MAKRLAVICLSGQMQCRRGTAVDADFTRGAVGTEMTAPEVRRMAWEQSGVDGERMRTAVAGWSGYAGVLHVSAPSQVTVTWLSRSRGQSASHARSHWRDVARHS